jgi:phage-related protein
MKPMKIIPVEFFQELSGNVPVRKWLRDLSRDDRRIIGSDIRTVQVDWPIGYPLVSPLGHKLWEVRSDLDNRIARIIFILHNGTMVLLHGFIKKSQKTPLSDIELALKRAKKYISENV